MATLLGAPECLGAPAAVAAGTSLPLMRPNLPIRSRAARNLAHSCRCCRGTLAYGRGDPPCHCCHGTLPTAARAVYLSGAPTAVGALGAGAGNHSTAAAAEFMQCLGFPPAVAAGTPHVTVRGHPVGAAVGTNPFLGEPAALAAGDKRIPPAMANEANE